MMMEIVYIVMIKDGIMLPSVFNDLFEEGEGRKALRQLSPLNFYKSTPQSVGFLFRFIQVIQT